MPRWRVKKHRVLRFIRTAALAIWACALWPQRHVRGFRVLTSSSELASAPAAVFEPYVHGRVGYYGDPSNPDPERVNEGSPFSPDALRVYFNGVPKQNCPGMVGPINDEEYYCRGREYSYCDQRSGLCVCNQGYTGVDCTECKPSYFKRGGICYPKKSCVHDCSQGGECDYATGTCAYFPNQKGDDCSQVYCQFDPLCTSCTSSACLSCVEGFFVDSATQTCVSRKKYDPRCFVCGARACLVCADPLLNSVRHSGARATLDAPLPFDELQRVFSFKFSYGSQDPRVFDEAESFLLVSSSSATQKPLLLNKSSKTCVQGANANATWSCTPYRASHRVCGHSGIVSFGSPIYAIAESAQNITLTVRRSGGGLGNATVAYEIQCLTASMDDVSPTAYYTNSQVLFFDEDVVELALQLTIHDDHIVEPNETFRVVLRQSLVDRTVSLGSQRHALVTILDDDAAQSGASLTYVVTPEALVKTGGRAGTDFVFKIQSVLGSGAAKKTGSDTYIMESYAEDIEDDEDAIGTSPWEVYRPKQAGRVVDNLDGTYSYTWQRKHAGIYTVAVYLLYPGGLRGDYFDDAWLELGTTAPVISRIGRRVNFTWGTGPIFPGASDYVAVRWSGRLKPRASGDTIFHVEADNHVRLWIDDLLLVDKWDDTFTGQASATIALDSSLLYAIVLEYRDLAGNARVQLAWSSTSFAKEIIPASNLFSAQHISGSPFYNVTILPTSTANELTTVIQGAIATIAGGLYRIEIFPIDTYGNPHRAVDATNGGMGARLTLTTDKSLGGVGSKQNDATITWDTKKQSLQATWTSLLLSGIYNLDVWVNGAKIYGSSFQVTVAPSAMHPTRSVVTGNGLASNRIAGVATTLSVEARGAYNNRIYSGDKSPELDIRAFHTTTASAIEVGTILDNGDGTQQQPVFGERDAQCCYWTNEHGKWLGLSAATTNVQASFQVTTRDLRGNDVKTGGATFQVTLELDVRGNATGGCTDLLSGIYSCTYTAKYVGLTKLHVILSRNGTTMTISGSPFAVDVVSGPALGSRCLAQGNGLVASVAGVRANFTVSIRDTFDNEKRNAGQETINVVFKGPGPAATTVAGASTGLITSFVGSDTFFVSYVLTAKGSYTTQVQVSSVDVHASPFSMYTYPAGPFPATTTLDLLSPVATTFTPLVYTAGSLIASRLTARDAFGNVLETGGYAFQFDDMSRFQEMSLVDEANGSYFLSLRPRQSGVFPFYPKILLTGGLNTSYFSNPNLVEPSILRRKDAAIDVDYDVTPPTQTDAMETFSVHWNGYLLPTYSEQFTFDADVLGGVSLSVNNTSLLAGIWPVANRTEPLSTPSRIYLVANQFVSIEVNYTKPKSMPNGRARLLWRSLSQNHEVIPPNRLFTSWKITNNVPALQIIPASAHPPSFTAEFSSATPSSYTSIARTFVSATAGKTLSFRVTARDQYTNVRCNGGDVLHALFPQLPLDVTPFPVRITDLNNATYEISFSQILSGIFSMAIAATSSTTTGYNGLGVDALAVFLRPYYIHHSPFTLNVEPNSATAATSTITGDGFYQAVAGKEAKMTIQLRDLHSNPTQDKAKAAGSAPQLPRLQLRRIEAAGSTAAAIVVFAKVSEVGDRQYEAAYTPTSTGLYEVLLSVANEATFTSKSSTLRVYPNIASALTSTISGGTGLGPQLRTDTLVTYRVLLNDLYSDPIETRGNNLVVTLRGPEIVYPEITQLSGNEYVVAYQVGLQGAYELQTYLANPDHGLFGNYFETTGYVGSVAVQVIDPTIYFDRRANETMRSYPRIQWKGFIKPLYSEQYTLQLDVFPVGAVYIDQSPVIDALNAPLAPGVTSVSGTVNLVGGRLHAITIEYRSPSTRGLYGFVALRWQSDRQQREIVPSTALFPGAQEINPRYTVVAVN